MRKRLSVLLLTTLLLAGVTGAYAASAGSATDPLVSLSYAKSWADSVISGLNGGMNSSLNSVYQSAKNYVQSNAVQPLGAAPASLKSGDTVTLGAGASVILTSGSARVSVTRGNIVNATMGAQAGNGRLNINHLYIVCEDSAASLTMSGDGTVLTDGDYKISSAPIVFEDVNESHWFYKDVYSAVSKGLISGMSSTRYQPEGQLTLAQAIKLAACMHQLYNEGAISLTPGEVWYQSFLDYALNNGIVDTAYGSLSAAALNAPVTRGEYVHIFYNALPDSEYAVKNSVADNAIPDVKAGEGYSAEIYAFYRAGIVVGNDTLGTFAPNTNIKRSEVAAVLTRMLDSSARASVTLG